MNRSAQYELAMFPLESVVLPGAIVPLHVFEPRYRTLVSRLSKQAEPEFAIPPITRGREVGGDDQRADVAVVANLLEAQEFADGRWAMVVEGTRRVSVDEWLADDPYPRATVTDWPDEPGGDLIDAAREVIAAFEALAVVAHRLDPRLDLRGLDFSDEDPSLIIWQLVGNAGLGALDTLTLLRCPGVGERAVLAAELIGELRDLLDALAGRDR